MTKAQLLALDQLSGSTTAAIQTANPDLATALHDKIAAQRKAAILTAFTGSSQELIDAIGKIDFSPSTQGARDLNQIALLGLQAQRINQDLAKEALRRISDATQS